MIVQVDEIDPPPPQQRTVNSQLYFTFVHLPIMSDSEAPAPTGIKRPRDDGEEFINENGHASRLVVPEMPSAELDDSDDEIGPMPDAPSVEVSKGRKKKRAVLSHERIYLENLPDTDRYTKSFMHRADINFVTMTKSVPLKYLNKLKLIYRTGFLLTTSVDGHLKLWKKQEAGIEFVKHYRASLKAIVGVTASDDGSVFATISEGGEGRVFDVVNFGAS